MKAFEEVKPKEYTETLKESKKAKKGASRALKAEQNDTFFFIGNRMKALLRGLSGDGKKEEKDEKDEKEGSSKKEEMSAKEKQGYVSNEADFAKLCLKNSKELKEIGLSLRPTYLRNRFKSKSEKSGGNFDYSKAMNNENGVGFGGTFKIFFGAMDWGEMIGSGSGLFLDEGISSLIGGFFGGMAAGGLNYYDAKKEKKKENEELVDEMDDIEFVDENGDPIKSKEKEKEAAEEGFKKLFSKLFKEGKSLKEASKAVDNEIIPELKYNFAMTQLEQEDIEVNDDSKIFMKEKASSEAQKKIKGAAVTAVEKAIADMNTAYPDFGKDNNKQEQALKAAENKVNINHLFEQADGIIDKVLKEKPKGTYQELKDEIEKQIDKLIENSIKLDEIKAVIEPIAKPPAPAKTPTTSSGGSGGAAGGSGGGTAGKTTP
ncbi:hypothetical protein [Defluviitalea saccharophila]|uniref:Uncharacterized protein n=1 Tax=Defluviitalea saccharophila TaxID=879970 RepID=A0ABZ2Y724_9FIRM